MKRAYWILLILGIALIAGGVAAIWQPWRNISKYSQDEVLTMVRIDLARRGIMDSRYPINGVCEYLGDGKWSGDCGGSRYWESTHRELGSGKIVDGRLQWVEGKTVTDSGINDVIVHWLFDEATKTTSVIKN